MMKKTRKSTSQKTKKASHKSIKSTVKSRSTSFNIQPPVNVCIVTPTYNERKNIKTLIDGIYSKENRVQYIKLNILMNVLVVDDNSPDGTAKVVKQLQQKNPNIHLLSRTEKNGLGAAYVAGMSYALKHAKPDIIFEMDADLSHDPKYIVAMIQEIRNGADFVIGSRYIDGGSIPNNWGMKRVMLSKAANVYAKTMLGINHINDCTGGFRAIRADALSMIDLNNLNTKGYAFQISLLEQFRKNGFVISEVPIHFKDRTDGQSKMQLSDILEEGWFVFKTSISNIFSPAPVPSQTAHATLQARRSQTYNAFATAGVRPRDNYGASYGDITPFQAELRGINGRTLQEEMQQNSARNGKRDSAEI